MGEYARISSVGLIEYFEAYSEYPHMAILCK